MVVSNFTTKMNFGLLFQKWSLGTQKLFCKVLDQLDTRLNNYGLISSQSMLIYHLKLKKQLYLGNGCSDRKNNDIFDPRGLRNHQLGNFDHIRHGGVKFRQKMNFGLLFQKWSLGTQKLFCKVLDQLDTRLNNYGLISSQSMLIYHLKLKTAVSRKRLLGSQK